MDTFTNAKAFRDNPNFQEEREESLSGLEDGMIDKPIVDIINSFNKLACCFTLQSCYGHFVHRNQSDSHNIEALSVTGPSSLITYRIAYIAFCFDNSDKGQRLFEELKNVPLMAPEHIQFGSAEWFWKRQVNSYVLQVEPVRFRHRDTAILDYEEALTIEKIRNEFFFRLQMMLHNDLKNA